MDTFDVIAQPLTGITYPTGASARGIWDSRNDSASVTGDGSTVSFSLATGSGFLDGFRIIAAAEPKTPPVPVPAGLPLLLSVVGVFALIRRRKV